MLHRRLYRDEPPRGWIQGLGLLGLLAGLVACSGADNAPAPRNINLYQDWSLQPGDRIANYQVHSGLGDVALDIRGNRLYMPFGGQVQPASGHGEDCVVVSSPEVPAYLFRLCGLRQTRLGDRRQGDTVGQGDIVALATLRRQADGTWAMVEPAKEMIEQFLTQP
ncbi:hypothetical protein E1H13_19400 [Nodosilinea sp. P-1105]|nr:hypothetical protein [Nodosilinea sp. P-1105]